jgi:hypothetical protein
VHGVRLDALGELGADGAGLGLLRVGCAHHLAVAGDGVLAFQHLHHDRAGNHEVDQVAKERPRRVHAVEGFRLRLSHVDALLRDDAQPGLFQDGVDLAGQVPARGIRLDDGKCALGCHGGLLKV